MAAKKSAGAKPAAAGGKPAAAGAKPATAGGGDLDAKFAAAQGRAKQLKERPDNDTLLRLYGLYKQGAEGDVHGDKPGFFDFVATAKYDAWAKLKGTAKDDAKKKYVDLVDKLAR